MGLCVEFALVSEAQLESRQSVLRAIGGPTVRRLSLGAVAASAVALLQPGIAAQAQETPKADPPIPSIAQVEQVPEAAAPFRQTFSMFVGGIDEEQALKAGNVVAVKEGFKILLDRQSGREIARVAVPLEEGEVQIQNTVYGDCGSSYFYLYDAGQYNDVMEFSTGFDVAGKAYDFDWWVDIEGPRGGYAASWYDAGPKWPSGSWDSGRVSEYTGANGYHTGYVRTTSRAYLTDGRICWSGGPSDSEYIS